MIALIASLFLVFYVVVPGALFRFLASVQLPLKKFHRTRTQEITFAAIASLLPFALTMLLLWNFVNWPFPTSESRQQRRDEYRVAFESFYTDKSFNEHLTAHRFWPATNNVLRRQSRFLFWYYVLIAAEASFFGSLTSKFAKLKEGKKWYHGVAQHLLLPSISEWHLILTDFGIPTNTRREIEADVLTLDNILYQGKLGDYFLDDDGNLSGLLLVSPRRFDRDAYVKHKDADLQLSISTGAAQRRFANPKPSYWKPIPSANLYIPASRIANINVRHEAVKVSAAIQERIAMRETLKSLGLTVEESSSAQQDNGGPVTNDVSSG